MGARTAAGRGWRLAEACVQERVQSRAYAPPQCPPTRSPPITRDTNTTVPAAHTLTRVGGAKPPRRAPASTQRRRATKPTAVATLAFIPSAYTSPAGVLARQRPGRAQALSGTPGVVAETAHQRHFRKRSAEVRALLAISAPTGAPSSEFRLDRVLAGLPEVQERVVTRRACMVHAWLVVCTRSGSRRRSSFRPRFAASPAHPGGCPMCAGHAAAVRPALRGHAGLWAGLAAKPAPFV